MAENTKTISSTLGELIETNIRLDEDDENLSLSWIDQGQKPYFDEPIDATMEISESSQKFISMEEISQIEEQDSEEMSQVASNSSSKSNKNNKSPQVRINEKSYPTFNYKKNSRMDFSIAPYRANLFRNTTLGISATSRGATFESVKTCLKDHLDFTLNLLRKYQEIDSKQYHTLIVNQAYQSQISKVLNQFFLLNQNFFNHFLIFFLNSYDEDGICRLFETFFLSFDLNSDKKMQMKEMIKCFEYLSKPQYIGKKKMKATFKEYDVYIKDSMKCFKERGEKKLSFNELIYVQLFEKFKYVFPKRKKLLDRAKFIDFNKLAPLMFVLFLEYQSKLFLRKKEVCENIAGLPRKMSRKGKLVIDKDGEPKGLYRVFVKLLKGEMDIKKRVVGYRLLCKAVLEFRSVCYNDVLATDSVERILKDMKALMDVDPVSCESRRKFSMKEVLPHLASRLSTEMKWKTKTYHHSIEKYDELVNCSGGALSFSLNRKSLHRMVSLGFQYLLDPYFDQFVKGLDFILHRLIPTLVSPAAIFIAISLIKTPGCVILDETVKESKNIKYNIQYILSNDNLFDRLVYFTQNTKLHLIFARLLYKDHYNAAKKHKKVNRLVFVYNEIIKNKNLFEDSDPGLYGKFDDDTLNAIISKDPKQMQKEEKMRKELKMRRFLEFILHKDLRKKEKIMAKRFALKTSRTFTEKYDKAGEKNKNERLFELQLQATSIDQRIDLMEREKKDRLRKFRESNAFPNSSDISPDDIFNCIKNSNNNSKDVEQLAKYIYVEKEKINFQDIQKFIINQHLAKIAKDKNENIIAVPTIYQVAEPNSNSQGDGRESDDSSFEEKYFTEVANRRSLYLKLDLPSSQPSRINLRNCCCTVI